MTLLLVTSVAFGTFIIVGCIFQMQKKSVKFSLETSLPRHFFSSYEKHVALWFRKIFGLKNFFLQHPTYGHWRVNQWQKISWQRFTKLSQFYLHAWHLILSFGCFPKKLQNWNFSSKIRILVICVHSEVFSIFSFAD